ncbi:hypothetical protein KAM429_41640 [Aquipseudomonas alcaligenes]|uniref:Endonuclease GajA/Old nuclease/RecF-like AAA domain-containing protein n=2 Tax=Aquipseudomonas alcaligenes TaxID=43263 RepID=A0AA37CK88_AQUAC|nr:hypothetical protein KAM426_36200 [Pseudomonas alcaligenes]BCR26270.1 hypothetical protein KAM426_37970 [Pseudomonas alcaligenes]GIZ69015.1 hypothetical protein KAM428_41000 [Pseudomonas alcaligenes]GIZ73403.1 hypothetical protein KAM429_41640 [Pseudomonas alcaligenes]GIZ77734.1 hypothetical protein KAM430_41430 [Pseudomonas alcaligenes]
MHISKLTLVNYRNFKNTTLQFHKGVNTIIGENGSGKSNILRAIRLLLDDTMVRAAYRLDESDFSRSLGQWQGHWIIISMEFEEISTDESVQALFLHGTATLEDTPLRKATYNLIFRPKKEIRLKLADLDLFDADQLAPLCIELTCSQTSSLDLRDGTTARTVWGLFPDRVTRGLPLHLRLELGSLVDLASKGVDCVTVRDLHPLLAIFCLMQLTAAGRSLRVRAHEAFRSDSMQMTGQVECKWVGKSVQLSRQIRLHTMLTRSRLSPRTFQEQYHDDGP